MFFALKRPFAVNQQKKGLNLGDMAGRKDNKGPERVGIGVEVKGSGKDANPWNI